MMNSLREREIENTLDTLEDGFKVRVMAHFARVVEQLEESVEKILSSVKMPEIELPGKDRYLGLFQRYLFELFNQGMVMALDEVDEMRAGYRSFSGAEVLDIPKEPLLAIEWSKKWAKVFGGDYYQDKTDEVVKILVEARKTGASVDMAIMALKTVLVGSEFNDMRLECIARTNATTAYNFGRLSMFRQESDFIPAVQFLAVLDDRTTDICQCRHGKIFMIEDDELLENMPPLHYMCRSVLSGIDRYEWDRLQKEGASMEIEGENRSLPWMMDKGNLIKPSPGFGNFLEIMNKVEMLS